MFLVTGATGKAGRQVVEHLRSMDQDVRALTRAPVRARRSDGVEIVTGDLTVPESLGPALEGVTGLHLMTVGGDDYATLQTGPEVVAMAEAAGVRRVTVLWNGQRGPVEEAVEASDLEWTRLEPVEFMSNALGWAESIRTDGVVRAPFPDVRSALVDEADVGAVAARALVEDGHAGKAYTLTGPAALTVPERVEAIGAAIGRPLRYIEVTEAEARQGWQESGYDPELVELLATWQGDPPPVAYTVVPTVEQVTGRPPRSFEQWALANAAAFQ